MLWPYVFIVWGIVVILFNRWVAMLWVLVSWYEIDVDRWMPWLRRLAVVFGIACILVGTVFAISGEPMFPDQPSS